MGYSDFDPNFQELSLSSKIVVALERVSQAFKVLLWQESKEHQLSPIQVQVLIFLLHQQAADRKVSFLAKALNVTKATLSETIKTLSQKGLIYNEVDPRDSRSYTIHLSEKGEELARNCSLFTEKLRQPIDSLAPQAQENMLLALLSIIRNLNENGIINPQRMCFTCQHYRAHYQGQEHYCNLLHEALNQASLRIDCPEHQLVSTT